jgi:hypothetical protein
MDRIDLLLEEWKTLDSQEKDAAVKIAGETLSRWRRSLPDDKGEKDGNREAGAGSRK